MELDAMRNEVNATPQRDEPDPDFFVVARETPGADDPAPPGPTPLPPRRPSTGLEILTVALMSWPGIMVSAIVAAALLVLCDPHDPLTGPLPTKQYHVGIAVGAILGLLLGRRLIKDTLDSAGDRSSRSAAILFATACYLPLLFAVGVAALTFINPPTVEKRVGRTVLSVPQEYLPLRAWANKHGVSLTVCWPDVRVPSRDGACAERDSALVLIDPAPSFGGSSSPMGEVTDRGRASTYIFKRNGLLYWVQTDRPPRSDWPSIRERIVDLVESWRR